MNRLSLIKLIKSLITKYLKNDLYNIEELETYIDNIKPEDLDINMATFYEQELLIILLKAKPYYDIIPFLNQFEGKLKQLSKNNNKLNAYIIVINGYLEQLKYQYKDRITQEIYKHLELLLINYKQTKSITIKPEIFLSNLYNPEELSCFYIAEQIKYEQLTFYIKDNIDLKDEISQKNYKNKIDLKSNIRKLIKRLLNSEEINNFEVLLITYIEKLHIPTDYKYILIGLYFDAFNNVFTSIKHQTEYSLDYDYVLTIK